MSGRGRIPRQLAVAGIALVLLLLALGLGPERQAESEGQAAMRAAIEEVSAQGFIAAGTGRAETPSEREGGAGAESRTGPEARAGLWLRLAGAAHRQGGWIAVFALQWSFCFFGALGLIWGLRPRFGGGGAIAFVAVGLFGSALALATTYLVPELLSFFCVALAGALVWGRRALPASEPTEVFQGELSDARGLWRWGVAGLAFGLALVAGPWLLPVAAPLVAAARSGRRWPAGGLFAAGVAVGFGAAIAGGGWPWAPLELWFDPALWGWNALFVLAGRSLGVLPFFLPAWIALARPASDEGRRWIPWSVLAALVLLLATAPFDLAGDSGAPLLASFLPLYALCLLLPAGDLDRRSLWVALVALPLVAPAWLDAAGAGRRPALAELDAVRRLLPLETTQRAVAGLATLDRASGVVLRGLEPAVRRSGRGRLELAGRRATLLVESAVPLSSVRLELGAGAPASFEVEGGELGDVLYRPNGDVAVDVRLGPATRRHPTWRSPAGAAVAVFDLVLPEDPPAPIPFDLSQARPEGFGEEP